MGRRSSSSGGRTSSSSRGGLFSSRASPAPATRSAAPPAAQQQSGGMLGNLAGSVMHGMASGVGWSMASRAVDSVIGPRSVDVVHRNEQEPKAVSSYPQAANQSYSCQVQQDQVNQCLSHASDMSYCQSYFEALKQCQTSQQLQ